VCEICCIFQICYMPCCCSNARNDMLTTQLNHHSYESHPSIPAIFILFGQREPPNKPFHPSSSLLIIISKNPPSPLPSLSRSFPSSVNFFLDHSPAQETETQESIHVHIPSLTSSLQPQTCSPF